MSKRGITVDHAQAKPILFNTEMVRAILDGRKSMTRRVIKPQPTMYGVLETHWDWEGIKQPYHTGDILYVRETFRIDYLSSIPGSGRVHYKADDTYADFRFVPERYEMMRRAQLKPGWRPNENMPKEAARLFLRVTDVRVERLQEIKQVREEGIKTSDSCDICYVANGSCAPDSSACGCDNEIEEFGNLWDSTIKKADLPLYGWAANPWVWVIEFERIEG